MKKEQTSFFGVVRYFTHNYEARIVVIVILAAVMGLVEAFNLALLFPLLSVGFGISTNSLPFGSLFETLGTLLPIGSPFVNYGLIFVSMSTTSLFLQLLYSKLALSLQGKIAISLKESIFKKIRNNDYRFFVDTKQGDLLSFFNQGPGSILVIINLLTSLAADMISALFVIIALISISWQGFLLIMGGGGFFYWIVHIVGKNFADQLGKLGLASVQAENRVVNEFINGAKAITASNSVNSWEEKYQDAVQLYWSKFPSYAFIQSIPMIFMNCLFYILIGIIVLFLYIYFASDFVSIIPIFGTFAAAAFKVLPKLATFFDSKLHIQNSIPYARALYDLLISPAYQTQVNGTEEFLHQESDIVLNKVSFAYHQALVLKDVSLMVQHRKMTAIVGPSGSGKSTLVNLLLRLYDPKSGEIIVNGKNLQDYEIGSFRDHVGYVSQDPFVFNASIKENICFGIDYTDDAIIRAAKLAHAHEFIQSLPNGYETVIGDQGLRLSGGEKQRIVIARAMIREPDLLILDEATSSLDNISELAVQSAIENVSKKCTTVIIAHRLSTIHNADRIYVLEYGKIVESGTHYELMTENGVYSSLYTLMQKKSATSGEDENV
jgi:ATP-binding cassette subfamily B protein/subfamily B ATP-binding cassette protein MsbA